MLGFLKPKAGERDKRGRYGPAIILACIAFATVPFFVDTLGLGNPFHITIATIMMIFAVVAMGLDIVSGYLGLGTLGHAGLLGASAYFYGIVATRTGWAFLPVFFLTILFALGVAIIFAALTSKLSGITFLMVQLALGMVIWGMGFRMSSLTGGDNGLGGIPRPEIFGFTFDSGVLFYYFIFFFFVLIAFLLYKLVHSPFGLTLHGIRNSPKRMRALGYDVYKHKFIAFIISGVVAGVAGVLLASFNQFIGPNISHVSESAKIFLMVLVGGGGTILGPIVGSTIVVALENVVASYTERWVTILGAIYVLSVMFTPRGVVGLVAQIRHKLQSRRHRQETSSKAVASTDGSEE
ncbi:MAG: branched-chain amino acid ABC transporter permease [Oscillospiraceae bacterium]|nr:branched-chain amino acid ABC transporter permease [Oscillospiraceae bacterium]